MRMIIIDSQLLKLSLFKMEMVNKTVPIIRIILKSKKGYLIASFRLILTSLIILPLLISFILLILIDFYKVSFTDKVENPWSISDETDN